MGFGHLGKLGSHQCSYLSLDSPQSPSCRCPRCTLFPPFSSAGLALWTYSRNRRRGWCWLRKIYTASQHNISYRLQCFAWLWPIWSCFGRFQRRRRWCWSAWHGPSSCWLWRLKGSTCSRCNIFPHPFHPPAHSWLCSGWPAFPCSLRPGSGIFCSCGNTRNPPICI